MWLNMLRSILSTFAITRRLGIGSRSTLIGSQGQGCPSNEATLLAKSADPLRHPPKRPRKGFASWVKTGLPGLASREQTANTDFANRSTARGARTIMARK
jgi:hypothetical protein